MSIKYRLRFEREAQYSLTIWKNKIWDIIIHPLSIPSRSWLISRYSHLTLNERYQISALMQNNISIAQIARALHQNRSTIYREIKINRESRNYLPKKVNTFPSDRETHNQVRLTNFSDIIWNIPYKTTILRSKSTVNQNN